MKPLCRKNYGSIPHLPHSRLGPGDHACHEGQARIATVKTRDKHDYIIVTEKIDGSNVGVARIDDVLWPIGRAGYTAISSPHAQHRMFHDWAMYNEDRFMEVLNNGERIIGEWIMQAHGTRYAVETDDDLFYMFDLMIDDKRLPWETIVERAKLASFKTPFVLHEGRSAFNIAQAELANGIYGHHRAIEPVEGAVWRVERDRMQPGGTRKREVDFLVKYVREGKIDGKYLNQGIWNARPKIWRKE